MYLPLLSFAAKFSRLVVVGLAEGFDGLIESGARMGREAQCGKSGKALVCEQACCCFLAKAVCRIGRDSRVVWLFGCVLGQKGSVTVRV